MTWEDRLKKGAYTSPNGARFQFDYENLERSTAKRTTVFEFPNVDDGYVQDNGHGPRRYPMRVFFWGPDHDITAALFEEALLERGPGKLEHPIHRTVNVVPVGDITRRDDLKDAANQTVLEVTFFSTLGAIYPSSQIEPQSEILEALDVFDVQTAQQFAGNVDLSTALNKANARATTQKLLDSANDLADGNDFLDAKTAISLSLDVLIETPEELAAEVSALIKVSATAGDIQAQLSAYADFVASIFDSPAGDPATALESGTAILTRRARIANDFHLAHLFAFSAVSAAALAVVSHTFSTKPEAIAAAEAVLDLHDAVVEWSDDGFEALGAIPTVGAYQVDTGESYQALLSTVALAAGYLVQISFTLIPERRIVLDRARTIIDLAAELYGSVDDKLDFIIDSNDLSGDEILELPRDRSILYYPPAA